MKDTGNLFIKWKHGQLALPKVYIIRIYYIDNSGCAQTCLKLGFTKQLLHNRVIRFLYEMRRATGFVIKQYELVSILYTKNYSGLEYALHRNNYHLHFFRTPDVVVRFAGSKEILMDTPENCNLLQQPNSYYNDGTRIITYNYKETIRSDYSRVDNVV